MRRNKGETKTDKARKKHEPNTRAETDREPRIQKTKIVVKHTWFSTTKASSKGEVALTYSNKFQ